jgi:hypothetical protein
MPICDEEPLIVGDLHVHQIACHLHPDGASVQLAKAEAG